MKFSVVEFRSHREMKAAIKKFDGSEFFGRRIKCIDVSYKNYLTYFIYIYEYVFQ